MTRSPVADPLVEGANRAATLVIWNPRAGGDDDGSDIDSRRAELRNALAGQALDAELFESGSEEETARRIEAAIESGVRTIVAAGGDGTVRSVAFQLIGREVALGILPLGTAMNVARSLGIPLDLAGAAAVLARGHVRSVDVGEIRGRPFLEIASIGLGSDVLAAATEVKGGRIGAAVDLVRRAWHYPRTRVHLELDGEEVRAHAVSLAVANGPFTGRGIELAPGAHLDDGKFDILVFRGIGGFGLLAHLIRALAGRTHDPRIARYRASRVRVTTHRPLPLRIDSQDLGTTPVDLVTRPGALRVIAP